MMQMICFVCKLILCASQGKYSLFHLLVREKHILFTSEIQENQGIYFPRDALNPDHVTAFFQRSFERSFAITVQ